jgi:putative addiction module CopG family antidote
MSEVHTMDVPLSDHWQRFVREEVRSGRFPTEAAVLEEALALLKQQEDRHVQADTANGAGARPIGAIIDELMSDVPADSV